MTHSIGRDSPAAGCGARRACALALMAVLSAASVTSLAATYTATNAQNSGAGSLRQAMIDANASGAPAGVVGAANTINITATGTIALSDALPLVFANLTINGNGIVIDGGSAHRCLFVNGLPTTANGTPQTIAVTLHQLHLNHCAAIGGDGGAGHVAGGGGMGAGGALFIGANAHVVLDQVSFDSNVARGGNGGSNGPGQTNAGGGGGLGGNGGSATNAGSAGGGGLAGVGGASVSGGAGAGGGLGGTGGNSSSGMPGDGGGGGFGGTGLGQISAMQGFAAGGAGLVSPGVFGGSGGANGGGGGGGGGTDGAAGSGGGLGGVGGGGLSGGGGGVGGGNGQSDGLAGGGDGGIGGAGGGSIYLGGNGGFGGGGGGAENDASSGLGGAGGFGGGAGGNGGAGVGGGGGFGGGGGGGGTSAGLPFGSNGGFGAGGGGGILTIANGSGGSFGGNGGSGSGGGGGALGASIFIVDSGSLTFTGAGSMTQGTLLSGSGGSGAGNGSTYGTGMFLQGSGTLVFNLPGLIYTLGNGIADENGSGGSANKWGISVQAGTLVLAGSNNYQGTNSVASGGVLEVDGSIASLVTVNSGAALSGTGTVPSILNGGSVSPGNTTTPHATLTATIYDEVAGSGLNIAADSTNNNSQLNITGSANLAGMLHLNFSAGPAPGTTYTVLNVAGTLSGSFAGYTSNMPSLFGQIIYLPHSVQFVVVANDAIFRNGFESGVNFGTCRFGAISAAQFTALPAQAIDGLPLCVPPITVSNGVSYQVTACQSSMCSGGVTGCPSVLHAQTGTLSGSLASGAYSINTPSQIADISAPVTYTVFGIAGSCVLDVSGVTGNIVPSYDAEPDSLNGAYIYAMPSAPANVLTTNLSNCGALSALAGSLLPFFETQIASAIQAAASPGLQQAGVGQTVCPAP